MKYIKAITILTILLLMLKTDYRFREILLWSVGDDSEYYYNVITLVKDFDLDFSNQLDINSSGIYKFGNYIAPAHPVGNGFLAFPFIFVSNYILIYFYTPDTISINYFIYSLVPIFYLFLSTYLLIKSVNKKYSMIVVYSIFGSGITYFAFERFSMSIVYEFFAVSIIIYIANLKPNKLKFLLLGFLPAFFLLIRTSSYHYFLIPILILLLKNKKIFQEKILLINYILGWLLGTLTYSFITFSTYGKITFTPLTSFNAEKSTYNQRLNSFLDLSNFFENLQIAFKTLKVVFVGQEFGLLYFSPILALSIYILWSLLKEKIYLCSSLYILVFLVPFAQIVIIQSIGFSYGYRYLFNLVPLNAYLLIKYTNLNKKIILYLFLFSINGLLSTLFFETTPLSSLSEDYTFNSFGNYEPYANKNYLTGYVTSLFSINSYLKIVFTSFFGVIILKIINLFTDPINLISNYKILNSKEINLIENSIEFDNLYIFIIVIFSIFLTKYFLNLSKIDKEV